jgi:ribosome-interacting GTPase 1
MPANLTPEYKKAEQAYREATTDEERLACLEYMLACIPKHKGTDHLQGDLKRRIAKLKTAPKKKAGARQADPFHIDKGGAGQAVLLGMPNCGKSAILARLTNARVSVTDYPYGTHAPVPGMAHHEDVPVQLVDMPPFAPGSVPPGMMGAYRSADVILIVVDLAGDALEALDACIELLTSRGMRPVPGPADREERDEEGRQPKTAMILGTKVDVDGAADTFEALQELYDGDLPMLPVSVETGHNLDAMLAHLFEVLQVIRVYSKEPGKDPDMEVPFVLPRGSTVVDMARSVHRDFPDRLKFACVWGSAKFDGQQVHRDFVLSDRDVVELHIAS